MESPKTGILILAVVAVAAAAGGLLGWHIRQQPQTVPAADDYGKAAGQDHLRATYDPIHFKPAIDTATDAQCLACHREVLDDQVRERSPAGISAPASKAWYQQLSTYAGDQDTFHRRHLVTPMAKELMNLRCTTCHQGNDPREEAPGSSATAMPQSTDAFTLRKQVNPETTCLTCHAAIRTTRHQVNYLKAEAIEAAGAKNADTCYGCHGGRSWYRISYPYPRHAWDGMAPDVPDWAKDRPTESEARFRVTAAVNPK